MYIFFPKEINKKIYFEKNSENFQKKKKNQI